MAYRFKRRWRQYRSRHNPRYYTARWRDFKQDKKHTVEPEHVDYICQSTDFFDCAEERVVAMLQRRPEVHALDKHIDNLRANFDKSNDALDGLVALLTQAPRASLAQIQMDTFEHGYRNKKERLFELIDFNDTLVKLILLLDSEKRNDFKVRVKQSADRICKRVGAPCFTDTQWIAIIRGLTREVAVYSSAIESGFNAWLTDRVHDALGIDLQVQDPEDGRYINIDVKTPSSFRHRMEQLVKEDRLTERELIIGDEQSYIIEHNGRGDKRVEVIVLCILPDLFGELTDWRFINTEPMRMMLNKLIREHGIHDGKYGTIID